MGRGNWFPGNSLEDSRVVYVSYYEVDEDEWDEMHQEYAYVDFMTELKALLPASFNWAPCGRARDHFSLGRDDNVVAENELFGIITDGQGDCNHFGVGILVRDDAPAFAASQIDRTWDLIMKRLVELPYELSGRGCAWTGFQITRETLAARG